jgi:hypothetical protein
MSMPWRLIAAHLRAHRLRSLLTMGSICVAAFLLCFLRTILVSMEAGVQASANNRLIPSYSRMLVDNSAKSSDPGFHGCGLLR